MHVLLYALRVVNHVFDSIATRSCVDVSRSRAPTALCRVQEAFQCFVSSKEEEKGSDCIEQFKAMQECFAAHPEEYGPDRSSSSEEGESEEQSATA